MTTERIAELRALADAATPGPWFLQHHTLAGVVDSEDKWTAEEIVATSNDSLADLEFIIAARTALPEALDAIEAARRIVDLLDIYAFGMRNREPFDSGKIKDLSAQLLAALEGRTL